ncbi:MAG: hypothetical protein JST86_09945 [Bacteroidetes bacterium]|nr:hypothetical protein [Bacteroidota bacterium]
MKQAIRLVFTAAVLIPSLFAGAQKTSTVSKTKLQPAVKSTPQKNTPVKEPPITDTLAYNVKKTIDKLSLFVLDPDMPLENLADSFLGNKTFGEPYYSSIIRFPGAIENTIHREKINRDAGTVQWVWTALLIRMPRQPENKAMLTALKEKLDNIVKAINYTPENEKNKFTDMSAYYDDWMTFSKTEEVTLNIHFIKPGYQTEQQSIDSLTKLYAPGLMNIETAEDASKKYTQTLLAEDITKEKVTAMVSAQLKKAADKDIKLGYQLLSGAISDLKAQELMASLSADQREKIRTIAQAFLDAYKEQRPFDLKTFDPAPPKLQYYTYDGATYTNTGTVNPNLYKQPEPQGKTVKCPICFGSGRMEVLDYSHTYQGIFSTITTSSTHWTTCTYCGGGGWITKYKKK